ncbi:MAG: M23 family metallopeptidase [Bacteroidetes bacterium]|nr:M23 family metallopeptidase [Bacteroidota bacterium]MBU1719869.1 M23 family metallopeptidase [Bacteroidota bacterium]
MRNLLLPILFFIFINSSFAQDTASNQTYRSPMDLPLYLSGSFAELRSNHFHSGIDIKTNAKEGYKVYAIADGYVSRIKISPWGYGLALYITHPSGVVAVYGHLQKYNDIITDYINGERYKMETAAIDKYIQQGVLPVKKGDIVGYSGNSGSSGGPHLHFEIRDAATERPQNPLKYGFNVADHVKPVIEAIKIYPAFPNTLINNKSKEVRYTVLPGGSGYKLNLKDTVTLCGWAYFGIQGYDKQDAVANQNGFYSVELYIDSVLWYSHNVSEFGFDETRYLNSHIDFAEYKRYKRRVEKSYIEPNNKLSIYHRVKNRGMFCFDKDKLYHVKYVVKDYAGNQTVLSFVAKGLEQKLPALIDSNITPDAVQIFTYTNSNSYSTSDFQIEMEGNCLYDSLYFKYSKKKHTTSRFLSPVHHVHDKYTPVHKEYTLRIKPDTIVAGMEDKMLVAKVIGTQVEANGGALKDGWMETSTREFGDYTVMIDTTAPKIKPMNLYENRKVSGGSLVQVKVTDDLSGINTYSATVNGKWILIEYEPRKDVLWLKVDEHFPTGKVKLVISVSDERNNTSEYSVNLVR